MRIAVDRDLCVGHARCQMLAPENYATDDIEGKVILLTENAAESTQADALRGAKACPERAITVSGADGAQIWPPVK